MEQYVRQAMQVGLSEIGFAEHAPIVEPRERNYAMTAPNLPVYQKAVEKLQEQFKGITIRIGLEADYFPGFEEKTRAILETYPYDYVIGSIHFIEGWGFDDPNERSRWNDQNIDRVYEDYYGLLRRSAESRLFDIMGHVDLVKKFGHRPSSNLTHEIQKTAEVFKKTGVAIEINTSGLRKPVGEIYPSLAALMIYQKAGVPITFGSDAHTAADVGRDFDKAIALAKAAGYTEFLNFKNRKIERKFSF